MTQRKTGRATRTGLIAALGLAVATADAPVAEAAPPSGERAVVTASTHAEGLVLRFELPRPVTELAFGTPAAAVRNESWTLLTPGLTLRGDQITAAHAFRRFELLVRPDKSEVDRGYPALVRVGKGHTFYGPYALVRDVRTELRAAPARGETVLPTAEAWRGYVYLGPQAYVGRSRGLSVVAAPTTPAWLAARIQTDVQKAVAFYARSLATPLSDEPAVILSTDGVGPMPLRGDVTDGLIVSLRFHGEGWDVENPAWAAQAGRTVLHETFHLWNGHAFHSAEGGKAPWLHEGGAEYAALVAGASSGLFSEDQAREQLGASLSGCRDAIGDRPLTEAQITRGSAVYRCGVALQWLADLEARRSGRDIFSVWRTVFARASSRKMIYALDDFRAAAGRGASGIASLLDGTGLDRWDRLEAALRGYGVAFKREPTGDAYRFATIFHLLGQHCTEDRTGYFSQDGYIKLDTRAVCGPLSGDAEIVAIESENLFQSPADAYRAVERKCRASQTVALQRRDAGPDILAPCTKPLPAPKPSYVFESAPALAIRTPTGA